MFYSVQASFASLLELGYELTLQVRTLQLQLQLRTHLHFRLSAIASDFGEAPYPPKLHLFLCSCASIVSSSTSLPIVAAFVSAIAFDHFRTLDVIIILM
ncbi:hypothetical protein VNO78_25454 [Psophocarpus tetragonolobus]|uniref:Uncharacterized protein n=1 Tax=Psophocarpus tetragonolobus TaxID=3891 RepID=A0AAN9S7F2_PSOTE